MDCPETRQGATLLLPVFVRGAMLSFGDVHAAQGDGEITGAALETTAPNKQQELLFNVGLALQRGVAVLTPEQELARKRAALEASLTQEIAAAAAVEQSRRAGLIRTIGFESAATQGWLDAKLELIRTNYDEQLAQAGENAEKVAQLEIERSAEIADAKMEHQNAVLANFEENNQIAMAGLHSMEAAYNTLWAGIARGELRTKKLRERMVKSFQMTFTRSIGEMVKNYIKTWLAGLLVTDTAKQGFAAKERVRDAKAGAVKAYQSMASIPIIGPALGAAAAAAAFAFLMAFQSGGLVPGMDHGRDSVPAILQPREFVINRPAVDSVGAGALDYINRTGALPPTDGGGVPIELNIDARGATGDELEDLTEYLEDEVVPRIQEIRHRRKI
jgi:hypothetical protein